MSRRLSNPEYAAFLQEVDLNTMGLPQWGGIVEWGGQFVMVYHAPAGDWQLTDVTDGIPSGAGVVPIRDVVSTVPRNATSSWNVFWYSLPQNFLDVAGERAKQIGDATVYVAQTVGTAAGAITGPLLGNLTIPLIALGIAALFLYGPSLKRAG